MYYIVTFDIPDDTTRRRVGDLLETYGLRVQRSVFEISCNAKQRRRLIDDIKALIDIHTDSVRFYPIDTKRAKEAFELGRFPDPFEREAIYFF